LQVEREFNEKERSLNERVKH